MPPTEKNRVNQNDEIEIALQSISERWRGDLTSFLDALARAKELASRQHAEGECVELNPETLRLIRTR